MEYRISFRKPHLHVVDFELTISNLTEKKTYLQLPAWRPGRYTLQNFAKNIRRFEVFDKKENPLSFRKVSKDRWEIDTKDVQEIVVSYEYFANQLDAGGCYLDEKQLYLNFICCALAVEGRENEAYYIDLLLPKTYQIACALPFKKGKLKAQNFFNLVDSPLIASPTLKHQTYLTKNSDCVFHLWVQGEWQPDWGKVIPQFQAFTEKQIALFGEMPASQYHFLFQILPYKFYHGVEHSNSTVIVLGADYEMQEEKLYHDFLGVSSHELFHLWNIMRIRPKEMMPYNLTQENYFRTGFIAEGITTYYGDLMLLRSGVYGLEQYFKDFETILKRHFENWGRFNLSVADSSYDLWLDGYEVGVPHRKSSIYVEGAVAAFILDIELRKMSHNEESLDSVLRLLWEKFGKKAKGYTEEDYQKLVEKVAGKDMQAYFATCIYGKTDLKATLKAALHYIGQDLKEEPNPLLSESLYGLRWQWQNNACQVLQLVPQSPAEESLTWGDEIVAINGRKVSADNVEKLFALQTGRSEISFFRKNELFHTCLEASEARFFPLFKVQPLQEATETQYENFEKWAR
jgi:predicted metalloprotease with PDZ domain